MTRIKFENSPSTNTPINAENLNKLNNVIVSSKEPTTGEEVWIQKGKNLIDLSNFSTQTKNGVTITKNSNSSLIFNGTSTAETLVTIPIKLKLRKGKYTHSRSNVSITNTFLSLDNINATMLNSGKTEISWELTEETNYKLYYIWFGSGVTYNNVTLDLQIEQGEVATSYEPYTKKIHTKNDNGYEEFYNEEEVNKEVYSTSEQRVGIWIDGKPLYRKIVHHTNALSSGNNAIVHNIPNIGVIAKVDGYTILGTNNYRTGAFESSTKFINIKTVDSTYINVQVGSDWGSSFKNGFVTILEYTKTTD